VVWGGIGLGNVLGERGFWGVFFSAVLTPDVLKGPSVA
jgi:hypothetical protein